MLAGSCIPGTISKYQNGTPKMARKAFIGSEIALSWSPMQLKVFHWQPQFHNWSPAGD